MQRRHWWIKVWTKEWLDGTIRFDLTPLERSIWIDLLVLAGDSRIPGLIQSGEGIPFPVSYLAHRFCVPADVLENCLNKLGLQERISCNSQGIHIINWGKYQATLRAVKEDKPQQHALPVDENLAKVAKLYEDNIGIITPITADKLKEITERYSVGWFEAAVAEAVENNVRKLVYIESILERWEVEGFKSAKKGAKDGKLPKPGQGASGSKLEGWKKFAGTAKDYGDIPHGEKDAASDAGVGEEPPLSQ